MRPFVIPGILAAMFGSAALVAVIVGLEGVAWREAFEVRQQAHRAERAAQAEAERQAAAQAARQAAANPVAPGFSPGFNPLNPTGSQPAAAAADAPVRDDLGGLPDSPGVEVVYYSCSACHGLAMVTQQHVTRARWDRLLSWMVEEQNMPELGEDRDLVLDYLTRHFGPQ